MTRTPDQALKSTHDHSGPFKAGMCKKMTREAYGVPSDGSEDATEALGRVDFLHRTGTPPRGAIVWYTGGRSGHGHVCIAEGGGMIRTTDLPTSGHWGTVPRDTPVKEWGLRYAGWSEDIDGVRVITVAKPKPKPAKPKPPSRIAKHRTGLLALSKDPSVGPARRRAAARAAAELQGFK